jgi:hypothetical protein
MVGERRGFLYYRYVPGCYGWEVTGAALVPSRRLIHDQVKAKWETYRLVMETKNLLVTYERTREAANYVRLCAGLLAGRGPGKVKRVQ